MSEIDASCPHCGMPVRLSSEMVDKRALCLHCERAFKVTADLFPDSEGSTAGDTSGGEDATDEDAAETGDDDGGGLTPFQVNIVGLDMAFLDLMKLMFKIMLAALPAVLCFGLILAGFVFLIRLLFPGSEGIPAP